MKKTLALVCVAGSVLTLATGCRGDLVATRSAPNQPAAATVETGSAPEATAAAGTAAAATGTGGPGTVTLTVTEPVQASGHAGTSVTCSTGRVYVASAESAAIDGYQLSFTVRATRYHGPGSYPALVTLRLDSANGAVTSVSGVPNGNATITADGGSLAVDTTGENGRALAATLKWTCG